MAKAVTRWSPFSLATVILPIRNGPLADVMGAALLPLGVEVTRTGVPNGTMPKLYRQ